MGRKRKSARDKRLDNFRSNRSKYLDSVESKKLERIKEKQITGHKVDDDKVKRRKVSNSYDEQIDQKFYDTSSQKFDKDFLMYQFVSDNREKLMQNIEPEMIKSSIDIDLRNFYKGFDEETIENIKINFCGFIKYILTDCIASGLYRGEFKIDIIHFVKLVFIIKSDKLIEFHDDNLKNVDTNESNFIRSFKDMIPKQNSCTKFNDEILREKFIKCENELLDKLKNKLDELDRDVLRMKLSSIIYRISSTMDEVTEFNDCNDVSNKPITRIDAIAHERNIQKLFVDSMLYPLMRICDFAYGNGEYRYAYNGIVKYEIPNEFKSQNHNLIQLIGQMISPNITVQINNSSESIKSYPIEIKLPGSIKNLIEEIDKSEMSIQNQKIYNEAILQMILCNVNFCFIADHNQTIMLHYEKNGYKNIKNIKQNNDVMVGIPFRYLVLDNTFESIINCSGDLKFKDKFSFQMIMLIISRNLFINSGDVKELLPKVSKTPKQVQKIKMDLFEEIMSNEFKDDHLSDSDPVAGSSSQLRGLPASPDVTSADPLVNDFKIFHCLFELPYVKVLSTPKYGGDDAANPSVILLCKKAEIEKLDILTNKESNDEFVVLKIYDIGWSQIYFDKKFDWKYNYEELDFKQYYQKYIYNGLFWNELKIMNRIQDHNDSVTNNNKKINVPSLLSFGMLSSYGYNGPFIIESYVDCIQNKPSKKEHFKQGLKEFNKLRKIGIDHNDIAQRNVGFDETDKKFWIIDFDQGKMLPEGEKYAPMNYSSLKAELECEYL
ncbi:hypothetical protein BN7_729 [Wickerhamomyces ciferrii]|uniref:Protein kinase domain-containing protein n=1 Tax=Wickerhamomyces ciferrii (strain ATCC 14091 / BCRC 22168 / CBS 111 / JCM 3599 / NBRC 0793 / NRRL Y-1031 F-60-10) TaxID=1206466 RepID=K0KG78_WICCF|nr:uncharacterized protein BN7_729 [Wickerhamomyces ciferrii]CCH41192.1 hypothetical protein BN7_729 [Wickerhamomyces ciferrii]